MMEREREEKWRKLEVLGSEKGGVGSMAVDVPLKSSADKEDEIEGGNTATSTEPDTEPTDSTESPNT